MTDDDACRILFGMRNVSFDMRNDSKSNGSPAVAKASRILWTVAAQPGQLGVSEIARRTGLSKSTVHGLLWALVDERLLTTQGGRYHLGTALAELGALARYDAPTAVLQPILQDVARTTGDTALLGRVQDQEVHILMVEPGTGALNVTVRVGSAVPVTAGALAKAYLAELGDAQARQLLSGPPWTRIEAGPRPRLERDVQAARRNHFAVERNEYLPGIAAAAAAFTWLNDVYLVWVVALDASHSDPELLAAGKCVAAAAQSARHGLEPAHEGRDVRIAR